MGATSSAHIQDPKEPFLDETSPVAVKLKPKGRLPTCRDTTLSKPRGTVANPQYARLRLS